MARKGIPTCYIRWVHGFLSDRKASVSWQRALSRKRNFSDGLPHGSVLAPILWLIYMDDLLEDTPLDTFPSLLQTIPHSQLKAVPYLSVKRHSNQPLIFCTAGAIHGRFPSAIQSRLSVFLP